MNLPNAGVIGGGTVVDLVTPGPYGCGGERPIQMELRADSLGRARDGTPLDYVIVRTLGSGSKDGVLRGQGWYPRSEPEECERGGREAWAVLQNASQTPVGHIDQCLEDELPGRRMRGSVTELCISRFRPDQIRGTAWSWSLTRDEGGTTDPEDASWMVADFEINFAPHSGLRVDEQEAIPEDLWQSTRQTPFFNYGPPDFDPQHGYCGGGDYDRAWPWEDITDPLIREIVYERYHPWQADYLPEDVGR